MHCVRATNGGSAEALVVVLSVLLELFSLEVASSWTDSPIIASLVQLSAFEVVNSSTDASSLLSGGRGAPCHLLCRAGVDADVATAFHLSAAALARPPRSTVSTPWHSQVLLEYSSSRSPRWESCWEEKIRDLRNLEFFNRLTS
jgi:hypothetical protein